MEALAEPREINAPHNMIRHRAETHVYTIIGKLQKALHAIEKESVTAQNFHKLLELRHDINWWATSAKRVYNESQMHYSTKHELDAERTMIQVTEWLSEKVEAQVLRYQQTALSEHVAGRDTLTQEFMQVFFDFTREKAKQAYR